VKNPVKLALKELPKYGARVQSQNRMGAMIQLPNGRVWAVSRGTPLPVVRSVIDDAYRFSRGLVGYERVFGVVIQSGQIRESDHFLERLELMYSQAGVTMREVLEVLANPREVFAHHAAGKLAVVGERVTPIMAEKGGRLVLVTLRWSTAELWARYPRPGRSDDAQKVG